MWFTLSEIHLCKLDRFANYHFKVTCYVVMWLTLLHINFDKLDRFAYCHFSYDLLCRIFSILQGSPSLLQPLDGVLAEALLLQLPVEVLDVEGGQLEVGDDVAEGSLQIKVVEIHLIRVVAAVYIRHSESETIQRVNWNGFRIIF